MREKTRTGVEKAMSKILDYTGYYMTKFERRNLANIAVNKAMMDTVAHWSNKEQMEAQGYANTLAKKALKQVKPAYDQYGKQAETRRDAPLFTKSGRRLTVTF